MPYIEIKTTKKIGKSEEAVISECLGDIIPIFKGKSEEWLMLNFRGSERMCFAGDSKNDCAMLSVELFGSASKEEYNRFTAEATKLVSEALDIPGNRIYVKYTEIGHWGFAGENF